MSRPKATPTTPLTDRDRLLIGAINRGEGRLRKLAAASGYASTSAVKAAIARLAENGHIVLLKSPQGERVYTGREFQQAWDAAARLAGNPEA